MNRLAIILILTSFNLFGQVDKKAYDVYSTIIREEFKLRKDTIDNLILINKGTTGRQISQTLDAAIETVEAIQNGQPIILSFSDNINEILRQNPKIGKMIRELKTNSKGNQLKHEFDLNCDYDLISKRKFEGLLRNDGLNKMRDNDPRFFGIIEFSNVVFNGDYAAVYCGLYIGTLNAVGTVIILRKQGTEWKIISRPEFWVS